MGSGYRKHIPEEGEGEHNIQMTGKMIANNVLSGIFSDSSSDDNDYIPDCNEEEHFLPIDSPPETPEPATEVVMRRVSPPPRSSQMVSSSTMQKHKKKRRSRRKIITGHVVVCFYTDEIIRKQIPSWYRYLSRILNCCWCTSAAHDEIFSHAELALPDGTFVRVLPGRHVEISTRWLVDSYIQSHMRFLAIPVSDHGLSRIYKTVRKIACVDTNDMPPDFNTEAFACNFLPCGKCCRVEMFGTSYFGSELVTDILLKSGVWQQSMLRRVGSPDIQAHPPSLVSANMLYHICYYQCQYKFVDPADSYEASKYFRREALARDVEFYGKKPTKDMIMDDMDVADEMV